MILSPNMKKLDFSGVIMEADERCGKVYFLNEHGQFFQVVLVYGIYENNGALALSLYCQPHVMYDSEYEPPKQNERSAFNELYAVVTVNLPESNSLPFGTQFVDVNNHNKICEWLIENDIAEPLPIYARSGFCIYPAYKFNVPRGFEEDVNSTITLTIP